MIKVGLCGIGSNGALHFQNALRMDGVKVEAVADSSKNALNKAKKHGVKDLYADYNELINSRKDLDAVVISLPNFLHYDCIIKCLDAGFNVFVEKPLASKVWQCEDIVRRVESTGLKVMVGHAMRYYPAIKKMKKNALTGRIGGLEFFTAESITNGPLAHGAVPKPVPEWWFDPELVGGGVLLDIGYHLIDLFHYFMGDSTLLFHNFDHKYNMKVEDSAIIILGSKTGRGASGYINVGWYQKSVFPEYDYRCIVHGSSGYLSSEDYMPRNMYTHAMKEGVKNALRKFTFRKITPLSYTYFYESFYKELYGFFESVRKDEKPDVSVHDGLRAMKIIEEAYSREAKNSDEQ